ncbi:hypothetical protein [Spirosoma endbachense]|uniref:Uncharacterized protein n=1 Tax=Spirosoma endbachense TaxID=2666025 RepID=A0A6P1VZQ3_9BACT|nr:hypothetical protein [Spirosoma endbachense]QHV97562.1 hypothetical protein GJR95_22260 [Spirosoma endbachense]
MDENPYDDYSPYDEWSVYYDPQAYAAANFDFSALDYASPSDAKLTADVTDAKATAEAKGNDKFANTLDFILKYGDKALSILTKNGILSNKNIVAAYPSYASLLGTGTAGTTNNGTPTDTTSNAPDPGNRVFNIDFSDPKVLMITFLVLLILFYFLFFNNSKNGKR